MAARVKPRSPIVILAALLLGSTGVVAGAGMTYFGLFVIALGGALFAWLLVVAGLFVMGIALPIAVQILRRRSWARRAGIALASCLALVVGVSALSNLIALLGLPPGTPGPNPSWPIQIGLTVLFAIPALLLSLPASAASFQSAVDSPSRR